MGSGHNGIVKDAATVNRIEFSVLIEEPMLVRRLARLEEATNNEECVLPNRANIDPPIILPIRDTNPPYLVHIFRIIRHRDIQGFLWFHARCVTAKGIERLLGSLTFKAEGTLVRVSVQPRDSYTATDLIDDSPATPQDER